MKHLMKKAVKAAVFAALTTLALTAFASAEGEMAIGAGCTTGTSLRMRSEPNTSSAIVTTLNKSVAVALLDDSVPGWYKINYNGSTGYVSSDYLILDQDNIFTTYGRVPEGTVNVRAAATTESESLATIDAGTVVTVNGLVNGWYDVTCQYGTEGYMSSGILIYNNKGFEMFYGSDSMATAYAETLNDCASQLSGTKVYSMVIPNHSEFGVPERVRNYYEEASQRENTMAVNNTLSASITAVDIYDALNLHNNEDIYFDTDTHWAPLGAFYAYEKFCEAAGVTPTTLDSFTKTSSDFTGYLAYVTSEDVLNNNPDTLDLYDPKYNYTCEISHDGQYFEETDSLNSHDESLGYAMYLHGDMGCVRITNHDLSTGRKLLVVKDSYGNAMGPFLGASFDEVHVMDFRYFEGDLPTYCTEHGITDVLFAVNEMAVNTEQHQNSIRAMFN